MSTRTYTKTVTRKDIVIYRDQIDRDELPHAVETAFYLDDTIDEITVTRGDRYERFTKVPEEPAPT